MVQGRAALIAIALQAVAAALASPVVAGPFEDGQAAYDRGDYGGAEHAWVSPALHGDARAQARLADLYEKG
ncbi:MAG TPA: hypothetical protein VJP88_02995, partial [Caulobacteraceae bacterium]|nr:hypothetical protein [Caulobacteraceae bacterium]